MLQIDIIGNIGNDAQVKDFNGKKYIAFNVAHSEKLTDRNGTQVERATWISCLKPGESRVAQYLKKGTGVFVRGDLSVKPYTDSNHQTQVGVNCLVRELQLLPVKRASQQQGDQNQAATSQAQAAPETSASAPTSQPEENPDNDLPF